MCPDLISPRSSNRKSPVGRWLVPCAMGMLTATICLVGLYVPSSFPGILLEEKFVGGRFGSSQPVETNFVVEEPISRLQVWVKSDRQPLAIILDLTGPPGVILLSEFAVRSSDYRFGCGEDLPAGRYTLRVHEQEVAGEYRIRIASAPKFPFHLRAMFLLGFMAFLSVVYWLYSLRGQSHNHRPTETARWLFAFGGSGICALFVYLFFHEGGHALLALFLGSLDLGRSDPFGFSGRPHIAYREDVVPKDWQIMARAAAGPLLPTLIGFFSYALWRSQRGRLIRSNHQARDIFWSLLTFGLLIGQIGMLLPISGLAHDGDYDTMVKHSPPVPIWIIDGLFVLLAVVAVVMVIRIAANLVKLVRGAICDMPGPNLDL